MPHVQLAGIKDRSVASLPGSMGTMTSLSRVTAKFDPQRSACHGGITNQLRRNNNGTSRRNSRS